MIEARSARDLADATSLRLTEESARLHQVNAFLEEILSSPDPRYGGREIRVVDALERARERITGRFGDDPKIETTLRMTLGRTLYGLGLFEEARVHQERAVALVDDAYPDHLLFRARARHQLAESLVRVNRRSEAAALYEESLGVLGDASSETRAGVLSLAGSLAAARGDFDAGVARMREALALSRTLPSPHFEHAHCLIRLGRHLTHAEVELAEGEALVREALSVYREILEEENPMILEARSVLAQNALQQGRIAEACEELTELSATMREQLGPSHADLFITLACLGRTWLALNEVDKAREISREVLGLLESQTSAHDPRIAASLANLAMVLRRTGDDEGCEAAYARAIEIQVANFGERNRNTALLRANYAVFLIQVKRYAEAEEELDVALAAQLELYGENHPRSAETMNSKGFMLFRQKQFTAALPWFRRALASWRASLPEGHERLTNALYLNATCEWKTGAPELGAEHLRECLEIQSNLPTPPIQRAATQNLLAGCLTDLGQLDEAGALFEESLPVMTEFYPPGHGALQAALDRRAAYDVAREARGPE